MVEVCNLLVKMTDSVTIIIRVVDFFLNWNCGVVPHSIYIKNKRGCYKGIYRGAYKAREDGGRGV